MAEAKLVLTADNSQFISKIKEAERASQKLYDTAVTGGQRNKGILEEIDDTLKRLEESRRKAFNYDDIERYNKKIAEVKQDLKEYEQAGLKANETVKKSSDGVIDKIGKMALAYITVTSAIKVLKETFLAFFTKSQEGINLLERKLNGLKAAVGVLTGEFIKLGKAMVGENGNESTPWGTRIVTGIKWISTTANLIPGVRKYFDDLAKSMNEAGDAAERLTLMQQELANAERAMIVPRAKANAELKKAQLIYSDDTKSIEERFNALTKAINLENKTAADEIKHQQLITLSLRDRNVELEKTGQLLDTQRAELEESMAREIELQSQSDARKLAASNQLMALSKESFLQMQKELEEKTLMEKWTEEYFEKESKRNQKSLEEKALMEKYTQEYFENEQERNQKSLEEKALMERYTEEYFEREARRLRAQEQLKYAIIQESIYAINDLTNSAANLSFSILNNNYNREIAAIDRFTKVRLEFAKGDMIETQRIQQEAEEKKLKLKEEYAEKGRKLEIAAIVVQNAIAIAEVIINTIKANAKAVAFSPLTFGQPWVGINTATAAISIAAIAASAAAAIIGAGGGKKFAKGGWTGDGTERDETGERVAGVVHEREFVVKKGPASQFREVLEAINKEDRLAVYNSFNKLAPELLGGTSVNNITVENSGPNNRLDRINNQLYQLNKTLTPRKQEREEVIQSGSSVIIRKGSNTRVIRR